MPPHHAPVIAYHLILSGYGFWLANDPRGSGSERLREGKFADLGPIHHGRKREQPTREELRAFYAQANPRLEHAPLWFDERMRAEVGRAFGEVIGRCRYTVWACFVGANHAHLCLRRHRDSYEAMWANLTAQARRNLVGAGLAGEAHPVWAQRAYGVFLETPADVRRVVGYIEGNARKEGLARQAWGFVQAYDGWPLRGWGG